MMIDVFIIRHKGEKCSRLANWLCNQNCDVRVENDEIGLVEASIPVDLLPNLKKLPCVAYVRQYFTWNKQGPIVVHPDDHL